MIGQCSKGWSGSNTPSNYATAFLIEKHGFITFAPDPICIWALSTCLVPDGLFI